MKYLIYTSEISNFLGKGADLKMDKLDPETKIVSIHLSSFAMMQLLHFPNAQELLPEDILPQNAEKDDCKFHSKFPCFSAG